MPSPLAHSVSGYLLAKFVPLKHPQNSRFNKWCIQSLYPVFVAVCPDFDFIPQIITGEEYHRGATHSLLFGLLVSVILGFAVSYWSKYSYPQIFLLSAIAYGSHLVLDFFTAGGKGMQLFWGFTDSFYKSPIPIFPGIQYSRGLWHSSYLIPIGFELAYSVLFYGVVFYWQNSQHQSKKNYKQ